MKYLTYEELVRKIGPGFHPDTAGDEYDSLPEGVDPSAVDFVVRAALLIHEIWPSEKSDPYDRALTVFKEEGWS